MAILSFFSGYNIFFKQFHKKESWEQNSFYLMLFSVKLFFFLLLYYIFHLTSFIFEFCDF